MAAASPPPMTRRAGWSKSLSAVPSRGNSGLTSTAPGASRLVRCWRMIAAVPGLTVLRSTSATSEPHASSSECAPDTTCEPSKQPPLAEMRVDADEREIHVLKRIRVASVDSYPRANQLREVFLERRLIEREFPTPEPGGAFCINLDQFNLVTLAAETNCRCQTNITTTGNDQLHLSS